MNVTILGSTGSIGVQTLDVIRNLNKNGYEINVVGLTANRNVSLLKDQIDEFNPEFVCVCDEKVASASGHITNKKLLVGNSGLLEVASVNVDLLVNAIVGFDGLAPTVTALKAGNDIALANKESLVAAGKLVMAEAERNNCRIIPIDSEHSAILQCLQADPTRQIDKIYLTASGGPFHESKDISNISVDQALNHPTWKMGRKITIDSATMINKGFEILEAFWLFKTPVDDIEVLVHRQSCVHSMVQFKDGNIIAQLGPSDMRLPIQYAFTYPKRVSNDFKRLDFGLVKNFTFDYPNKLLRGIELCKSALKIGGTMPAVLCIANDLAVERFLEDKLSFAGIYKFIDDIMSKYKDKVVSEYNLEDVLVLPSAIKKDL